VPTLDPQFEPMTVGMVLDRSFRLYTQNFPLMLGITAILNVPALILAALPLLAERTRGQPLSLFSALAALSASIIALLSTLVIGPLVTGATTKAVSDKYLGNPVSVGSALKEAWSSVGTLLLTQLVVGLVVGLGLLLLVVPGILWMLSYSLVAPVIIIEASNRQITRQVYSLTGSEKSPRPAIVDRSDIRRRSWELVKGNRGKVFAVLFVFVVMQILLGLGATSVVRMVFENTSNAGQTIQSVLNSIVRIAVSPLQTIALTLLYYDFRIRKEGFDLEMLSEAMGNSAVKA